MLLNNISEKHAFRLHQNTLNCPQIYFGEISTNNYSIGTKQSHRFFTLANQNIVLPIDDKDKIVYHQLLIFHFHLEI